MERIKNLDCWAKENDWNGHFRFAVAAKCAYEIFVECWYMDTPIETAKGSLCVTGMWRDRKNGDSVEREWIGKHLPIQELLEIAEKDYKENMN